MADGFAIKSKDGIDLRTVGPTAQSAKVNWLFTEVGVFISAMWTAEQIETVFKSATASETYQGTACVRVSVTEAELS